MKGVDAVARILQQEGVEFLFSYPNNNLIDSAAAIGIRPIIARTEKTLLNMTDGFSRATNGKRLGVCVVQGGPGIENAYGGMAQAYADSIPLLLMPGGGDQRNAYGPAEFDPLPTYATVTKWASAHRRRESHPGVHAPRLQPAPHRTRPARCCWNSRATWRRRRGRGLARTTRRRAATAPWATRSASPRRCRSCCGARRPLLHVGHGVLWAEAWDELREFAELVQVPVADDDGGQERLPRGPPALGRHLLQHHAPAPPPCFLKRGRRRLRHRLQLRAQQLRRDRSRPARRSSRSRQPRATSTRTTRAPSRVLGDAKLVLRQLIEEVKRQAGDRVARKATPCSRRSARPRRPVPRSGRRASPRTRHRSTPTA